MRMLGVRRFLEAWEWSLDESVMQKRQVRVRVPLLGIDLLRIDVYTVMASSARYPEDAQTVEPDTEDALLPAAIPSAPEAGDPEGSDNTSLADMPPSHL